MAVADDGILYVNTWSGAFCPNGDPPAGGIVVALKDNSGDGKADALERFARRSIAAAAAAQGSLSTKMASM